MSPSRCVEKLIKFADFAESLSKLATCKRAQVGSVIISPTFSEVFAIGYNGQPAGLPNDGCTEAEGDCGCCHAEQNAVTKLGNHPGPLIMLTSTQPCWRCAGMIVNKGISHVVYWRSYREGRGLDTLLAGGVKVAHMGDLKDERIKEWWPHG